MPSPGDINSLEGLAAHVLSFIASAYLVKDECILSSRREEIEHGGKGGGAGEVEAQPRHSECVCIKAIARVGAGVRFAGTGGGVGRNDDGVMLEFEQSGGSAVRRSRSRSPGERGAVERTTEPPFRIERDTSPFALDEELEEEEAQNECDVEEEEMNDDRYAWGVRGADARVTMGRSLSATASSLHNVLLEKWTIVPKHSLPASQQRWLSNTVPLREFLIQLEQLVESLPLHHSLDVFSGSSAEEPDAFDIPQDIESGIDAVLQETVLPAIEVAGTEYCVMVKYLDVQLERSSQGAEASLWLNVSDEEEFQDISSLAELPADTLLCSSAWSGRDSLESVESVESAGQLEEDKDHSAAGAAKSSLSSSKPSSSSAITIPTSVSSPHMTATQPSLTASVPLCASMPQLSMPMGVQTPPPHRRLPQQGRCLSPPDSMGSFAGSFEESILSGRVPYVPWTMLPGFTAHIKVVAAATKVSASLGESSSGVRLTLAKRFDAIYYHIDTPTPSPYVGYVGLDDELYRIPSKGTIQLTVSNPSGTPVKLFVLKYDIRDMPSDTKTCLRQSISSIGARPVLYYAVQMFLICRRRKKYLHKGIRVVFPHRVPDESIQLHVRCGIPSDPKYFATA